MLQVGLRAFARLDVDVKRAAIQLRTATAAGAKYMLFSNGESGMVSFYAMKDLWLT
jgi:hypothetical protein